MIFLAGLLTGKSTILGRHEILFPQTVSLVNTLRLNSVRLNSVRLNSVRLNSVRLSPDFVFHPIHFHGPILGHRRVIDLSKIQDSK